MTIEIRNDTIDTVDNEQFKINADETYSESEYSESNYSEIE